MSTGIGVYKAIARVQAYLASEGVAKEAKNTQQGWKFRSIDSVYNAIARPMSEAGLCILPRMIEREVQSRQSKTGGTMTHVILKVEYDLVAAEDGSKHTISAYGESMDSGDKAFGKAMSYAYKNAIIEAFAIPVEGDGENDADAVTHEVAHRPHGASSGNTPAAAPPAGGPHQNGQANRVAGHLPTGPTALLGTPDAERVVALMAKANLLSDLELVASKHIAGRQWQQPALDYLRAQFRQHKHRIETATPQPQFDDIPFE